MTYFWVNSCTGVMLGWKFTCFAYGCQLFLHYLLKRLSFFHWITFTPLSKISWTDLCGFISGFLYSIPLIFVVYPLPLLPTVMITRAIQWAFTLGRMTTPSLFFIEIILATLGPLTFHINFIISLAMSTEIPAGIWIGILLTYRSIEENWHLYYVESFNSWTQSLKLLISSLSSSISIS